jgi:hypothetical protein
VNGELALLDATAQAALVRTGQVTATKIPDRVKYEGYVL